MNLNFFKKTILCASLISSVTFLGCSKPQKKGFSLEAISTNLPFNPNWETQPLNEMEQLQVEQALSQPYRYLGGGGQCYSFESQDGKYVIKFFKQKKFAIPVWMDRFPLPFLIQWKIEKKKMKRAERRNKVFSAFKLCFEQLPQESGLLYLHLNPSQKWGRKLSLVDMQGKTHLVDLDTLEFVIQKKAQLAYQTLDTLMANHQLEEAKQAIDQLLDLNLKFYRKGLRNRDVNFRSNCGFIGTQPILIDVGRIVYSEEAKEPKFFKKELLEKTEHFRSYLLQHYPELLAHFDERMENINS
jgi:tetratricopeptide (TPR) repeat protein